MPTPDSVVENGTRLWGRLDDRPRTVNPLDAYSGPARAWHAFRLKEWVGFTLAHGELFSAMIMQDAKYLASSEFYVYDREWRTLHEYAGSARGGSLALPADLLHGGACRFASDGYRIDYDFDTDAGCHRIRIDIAASAKAPAVRGELLLDAAGASAPLSVSARLGGGGTMYTHKAVFPASGTLTVGGHEYRFDPQRDFAILDEHRSELPYRSTWTWGTFAQRCADGSIAAANFCARPQPDGEEEESGLWLDGRAEPLSDVTFEPASDDPLAPIAVRSADGRLDVEFVPEGRKGVRQNFGVVAVRYHQLFGAYRGRIGAGEAARSIDGAHGVVERMLMRA
ncbi:DUF2804 domain-containing protein [Gryllotalpicola ginsengisoli]|uniref:DUF2804 domain-containing protein n=1 Tax=Gryllotalpicola ginsengisoli TaxID=444608 RepID=UPI000417BE0E|nr:DUF2804 domain-containing protein [Gryllotalpicola ginsengisoli]